MSPPSDTAISRLAGRQHGLVTTAQLAALSLDSRSIDHRLRAGTLHRVHRGVYAFGHGLLEQDARWRAAVLRAGDDAALSHASAAALWRIWRGPVREHDIIHVVSLRQRSGEPGICFHQSRHLDQPDACARRDIPVTSIPRTIVDLADMLDSYQLANVIDEAAFRYRVSVPAIRTTIERLGGRDRLHVVEQALAVNLGASAGTKSRAEDLF